MKRSLALLILSASLALGLLSACTQQSPAGPNPGAIVPGEGIAEVQLFDSRQEVEAALGAPPIVSDNPFNKEHVIVQYPQRGLEISYLRDTVGSIVLYSSGLKDGVQWVAYQGSTKEGIWPDSKAATIKTKLGQPYKELPQAYVYNGLWVRLDDEGGVESFSISKDEVSQLESLNI